MTNSTDYHRSVELSLMRRHMAYTEANYIEDWSQIQAMSQMMAEDGRKEHLARIMDGCMDRVLAYQANNPNSMPFDEVRVNPGFFEVMQKWVQECTK